MILLKKQNKLFFLCRNRNSFLPIFLCWAREKIWLPPFLSRWVEEIFHFLLRDPLFLGWLETPSVYICHNQTLNWLDEKVVGFRKDCSWGWKEGGKEGGRRITYFWARKWTWEKYGERFRPIHESGKHFRRVLYCVYDVSIFALDVFM